MVGKGWLAPALQNLSAFEVAGANHPSLPLIFFGMNSTLRRAPSASIGYRLKPEPACDQGDEFYECQTSYLPHTLRSRNGPALLSICPIPSRTWFGCIPLCAAAIRKQSVWILWTGCVCVLSGVMGLCLLRRHEAEDESPVGLRPRKSSRRRLSRLTAVLTDARIEAGFSSFAGGVANSASPRTVRGLPAAARDRCRTFQTTGTGAWQTHHKENLEPVAG